jgi:hypothetical protein
MGHPDSAAQPTLPQGPLPPGTPVSAERPANVQSVRTPGAAAFASPGLDRGTARTWPEAEPRPDASPLRSPAR